MILGKDESTAGRGHLLGALEISSAPQLTLTIWLQQKIVRLINNRQECGFDSKGSENRKVRVIKRLCYQSACSFYSIHDSVNFFGAFSDL